MERADVPGVITSAGGEMNNVARQPVSFVSARPRRLKLHDCTEPDASDACLCCATVPYTVHLEYE